MSDIHLFGSMQADFVMVRYGQALMMMGYITIGAGSAETFAELADRADEKMRERLF